MRARVDLAKDGDTDSFLTLTNFCSLVQRFLRKPRRMQALGSTLSESNDLSF